MLLIIIIKYNSNDHNHANIDNCHNNNNDNGMVDILHNFANEVNYNNNEDIIIADYRNRVAYNVYNNNDGNYDNEYIFICILLPSHSGAKIFIRWLLNSKFIIYSAREHNIMYARLLNGHQYEGNTQHSFTRLCSQIMSKMLAVGRKMFKIK